MKVVVSLVCGFAALGTATQGVASTNWREKRQNGAKKEAYEPHVIEQPVCMSLGLL